MLVETPERETLAQRISITMPHGYDSHGSNTARNRAMTRAAGHGYDGALRLRCVSLGVACAKLGRVAHLQANLRIRGCRTVMSAGAGCSAFIAHT